MRMALKAVGLVAFTLALALPLSAQDSPRRGLWGGFGFGAASIDCESCTDRTEGIGGFGVIGGTLSDVVRIGGGVNTFFRDEDGQMHTIGSALFIIQVFPNRGSFFFKGGAGFATSEIEQTFGDIVTRLEDQGAALLIGMGYNFDLGQSKTISITPYASWMPTGLSFEPNVFQLGVGVFWN